MTALALLCTRCCASFNLNFPFSILGILVIFPFVSVNAQVDNRLLGIDVQLEEILGVTNTAGFSIAIVEGDKVIYSKGFGYRDHEVKLPVDNHTMFAIGSATKAFTSSILGQLRDEGRLSFEDSPLAYIPELKFYNDDLNNHLNIEDLMSMRSGLASHDAAWSGIPTHSKDTLIQRIQYLEPFTGLRQRWNYSNLSFLIQGVIAEKLTGKSWEENIRERFFKPLGMSRSNLRIQDLEKDPNAASGYTSKNGTIVRLNYFDIAAMGPAGSINSTANDISKWLITWINKGEFEGRKILSEEYVNEAISSHMVIPKGYLSEEEFPNNYLSNYGYGWIITSYKGHYRVEHGGSIDGFRASVALFPDEKIGIVVLTNNSAYEPPLMIRNIIADRMLNTKKTDWTKQFKDNEEINQKTYKSFKIKNDSNPVEKILPETSHALKDFAGKYSNKGYGDLEVKFKNDSLFMNYRRVNLYLKPLKFDIFSAVRMDSNNSVVLPSINFTNNNAGKISQLAIKLERTLDPIEFKRQ